MRRALPRSRIVLLGLLVVFTFASTPVLAQPTPACTTIELTHVEPPAFAPGETKEVTLAVANTGSLSEAVVNVRVQIAEGWSVQPAEQAVTVAAGATESAVFQVTASDVPAENAQMNVQAQGDCSSGGTAFPLPGVAVTNTATTTLVLQTVAPSSWNLPDLANVPAQYFFGAVGLVAVVVGAFFAMRRTGNGFQVTCGEPEKPVRAGRGTSFPVEIKNRGREPETAHFEVGEVPAGWNAFMALPEVTLGGGESRTLWLMVRAPPDATPESSAVVPLRVRHGASAKDVSRIAVRAVVKDEPDVAGGDAGATVAG